MISSTPATALTRTKRNTEMRCIQTCRVLGVEWDAVRSGGSRSAVRVSFCLEAGSGALPGALEKGGGSAIRDSVNRRHGKHYRSHRVPGGKNWGEQPSGYSTTSGP